MMIAPNAGIWNSVRNHLVYGWASECSCAGHSTLLGIVSPRTITGLCIDPRGAICFHDRDAVARTALLLAFLKPSPQNSLH